MSVFPKKNNVDGFVIQKESIGVTYFSDVCAGGVVSGGARVRSSCIVSNIVVSQTYPRLCEQAARPGVADGAAKRNVPATLQRLRDRWHHNRLGRRGSKQTR